MKTILYVLLSVSIVQSQTLASSVAAVNSNINSGGGTDDTTALQSVLSSGAIELIQDGVSLVSQLIVASNTTIRCTKGGGFFQKDASNKALIRNANRTTGTRIDTSITISGCTLNGNKDGQGKYEDDNISWVVPLQFFGVDGLTFDNLTVRDGRNFSMHLANVAHVRGRNVQLKQPNISEPQNNYDGIHINGNSSDIIFRDTTCTNLTDDCIALNADDGLGKDGAYPAFGSLVAHGPITDALIDGLTLDNCLFGIRILSNTSRVDRITARNITGRVQEYVLRLDSHSYGGEQYTGSGNIGRVLLENVAIEGLGEANSPYGEAVRVEARTEQFPIRNFRQGANWYADYRPIVRVLAGSSTTGHGHIVLADFDLSVYDPSGTSGFTSTEAGSRVVINGSIDVLDLKIQHERESSVSQAHGSVAVVSSSTTNGIGDLSISGRVNRQWNTVAQVGGRINRIRFNGFTDIDNNGAVLYVADTVVAPEAMKANLRMVGSTVLLGGAQSGQVTFIAQ